MLPGEYVDLPDWVDDTTEMKLWGRTVEVPKPPTGMLKQSRERWATWWVVPEASMLRPHHMPALERLIRLYDEEERLRRRVSGKNRVVRSVAWGADGPASDGELVLEYHDVVEEVPGHLGIGSTGQLVEHPDWKALMKVRERIQSLEDRFAGTPLAEFRLGWQQAAMMNEQARAREAQELASAAAQLREQHQEILGAEIVEDDG